VTTDTVTSCTHEQLLQYSTIHAMTIWLRSSSGPYEPQQVPCSKVIEEETERWICADCGASVFPSDGEGYGP
jgi:hypothetical protein